MQGNCRETREYRNTIHARDRVLPTDKYYCLAKISNWIIENVLGKLRTIQLFFLLSVWQPASITCLPFAHSPILPPFRFDCKQTRTASLPSTSRDVADSSAATRPTSRSNSSAQGGGAVATMPPRHREIPRGLWVFYGDIWGPAPISISPSNGFSNSTRRTSEKFRSKGYLRLHLSIISIIPNPHQSSLQLLLHPHLHPPPAVPRSKLLWISPKTVMIFSPSAASDAP